MSTRVIVTVVLPAGVDASAVQCPEGSLIAAEMITDDDFSAVNTIHAIGQAAQLAAMRGFQAALIERKGMAARHAEKR